eukprot:scaffold1542_cov143-Skeletonema_marinoi.AAC.7
MPNVPLEGLPSQWYCSIFSNEQTRVTITICERFVGVGESSLIAISMRTMWILGMRRPYKRTSQALRDAGRNEIAPVGIPTPHVDG